MGACVAAFPDQQNVFIGNSLNAVAQTVTALAIQGITILNITIGESAKPTITVQYNQRLVEALGLESRPRPPNQPMTLVMHCKEVGGCLLYWQQRVGLH